VLGLPQLKLAWIVASGPEPLRDEALARLEFVADAFLSVSPMAASMLAGLFTHRDAIESEIRARIGANFARLVERGQQSGAFEVLPAEAGWGAIVRVYEPGGGLGSDGVEEVRALALVEGPGVIVQPGYLFDLEPRDARGVACSHFVLSLLAEPKQFDAGVTGLVEGLGTLPPR
jgi:alanine-synthesizing transaminase